MSDATTTMARAWAVRRNDGLELGFTDHDAVLHFAGLRFHPRAGMAARALVQGTGLAVDNSEAVGVLSDDAISEVDLRAGRWDGAEIRLWEVDWSAPARHRLMFRGTLGEVSHSGGGFRAELRGLSEPLNQPRGRVYHPRCSAVLGDGGCMADLSRPGYRAEGVIEAVVTPSEWIVAGFAGHDNGWFAGGRVALTGGRGEGLGAVVRLDEALPGGRRRIALWQAPGSVPDAGDALRLEAGCDKSAATCRLKFDNYLNFRGFPHLPPEDWLLAPKNQRARKPPVASGGIAGGGVDDGGGGGGGGTPPGGIADGGVGDGGEAGAGSGFQGGIGP